MRSRWLTGPALTLHFTIFPLVGAFLALAWWQLHRALSGNTLSWFYTFEWPFFAAYAVYMWWKLIHDDVPEAAGPDDAGSKARQAAEDERMAAYNRYLAELAASGRPKTWRHS